MNLAPDEMIDIIARGFGDMLDRFVFIGGATAYLYYQTTSTANVRPTNDVDCVIQVTSRSEYYAIEKQLEKRGFKYPVSDDNPPTCRKIYEGIRVDIMPTDDKILGYSNRWFEEGIQHSQTAVLPSGIKISLFTLPYFIAAKIEAYHGRGETDFRYSHDIEDIALILDSQRDFALLYNAPDSVKSYLQEEFSQLLQNEAFQDTIYSFLGGTATSKSRSSKILGFMKEFIANEDRNIG